MMRQNPGIRDVALAASVSVTTVSHALSGRGHVSAATRLRVAAAAAALGYAPNRIARALRSQKSNLLGFISEEIATTPYAGQILVGAQEAAAELGVMLMIVNVPRGVVDHPQIDALLEQQVDAVIFASSSHRMIHTPRRLDPTRTILLDAFDPHRAIPAVIPDEVSIGFLATRTLLDAGHRCILHISVDEDAPAVGGRERGYIAAMREIGEHPLIMTVPGPADAPAGSHAIRRALASGLDFTAVFAFNDQMAMGVYQEVGSDPAISIPVALSVIGVDNLTLVAEALRPGLTTVALPHAQMGRRAVELAALLPTDADKLATIVRLPGELVCRDSIERRS